MEVREHTISMLVNNKPGVLARVSGVFGRLGYNIESLCVAETISPKVSRITSVSKADSAFIEKVRKQLERLVDVIEVHELERIDSVQREMILIGITINSDNRTEVLQAIGAFGCRIISMKQDYCILQVAGSKEEAETTLNFFKPLGITQIARTGAVALPRVENTYSN
ncbi:MAG: acetolactate synthase small subunit [Deltaproteobacteria bacterium]|nr:acetolactate synthase small subunit [Deltaproteobacteria bacterium]